MGKNKKENVQSLNEFLDLFLQLPESMFIIVYRRGESSQGREEGNLWVSIYEDPPDDGWSSRGAYLDHDHDAKSYSMVCPEQYTHSPVVRIATGSGTNIAKTANLAIDMLRTYVKEKKLKKEKIK